MKDVIGDLSDLILDMGLMTSKKIKNETKRAKRTYYHVTQNIIHRAVISIIYENNLTERIAQVKRLNCFLNERLKTGYVEDGSCYIEIFDEKGETDRYYVADVELDKKTYKFIV